jgi:hypothetical protein
MPIHYGATGDPAYVEQPNAIDRFVRGMATSGQAAKVLTPGQSLAL